MKRSIFILIMVICVRNANAQGLKDRIEKAYKRFETDEQLSNAISSFYVIEAETGKVVFDMNSRKGLAGASTQKVITAATAFSLLREDFRFETSFYQDGNVLDVIGTGDPSLGSDRYSSGSPKTIFELIEKSGLAKGLPPVKKVNFWKYDTSDKLAPAGWINEDMGNYYGAAAHMFNWKENQFDLVMKPADMIGRVVTIDTAKTTYWKQIVVECFTGEKGSGDNAYIYFIPGSEKMLVKGTIPFGVDRFTISGADPYPELSFVRSYSNYTGRNIECIYAKPSQKGLGIASIKSPSLDSMVYWFLKKSINLYGEALLNKICEQKGYLTHDSAVSVVQAFWKAKGIDERELNIYDGSGLSPLNRLTTHAQVEVLRYAKTQKWFAEYFAGFPEYNGMKIKSGTINDVKGFCGYHTSKTGKQYIFSFLVNNYNGKSSTLVAKMFKVLDELK